MALDDRTWYIEMLYVASGVLKSILPAVAVTGG